MMECDVMQDRMPAVARGEGAWNAVEASHLTSCADCAHEWQLVRIGVSLHAGATVDADRIADEVLARLRAEPAAVPSIRRIPWRGGLLGLLSAAASVALVIWAPRPVPAAGDAALDAGVEVAVLPELQQLSDTELEVVLQSLGPTTADAAPGAVPHLEDLTDSELEQLLSAQGDQ